MRQHRQLQQSDYGGWGTEGLHGAQKPRCAMQCGPTHRLMRRRTVSGRGLQPRSLHSLDFTHEPFNSQSHMSQTAKLQSSHENSTDFRGLKMLPLPRLPTPLNTAFRGPASAGPAAGLTSHLLNPYLVIIPLYNAAWLAPPPVLLITVFLGSPPLSITHILCLLWCFFGHCFEASSFHNFFVAAIQFRLITAVWCPSDSFIPHTHAAHSCNTSHTSSPPLAAAWC